MYRYVYALIEQYKLNRHLLDVDYRRVLSEIKFQNVSLHSTYCFLLDKVKSSFGSSFGLFRLHSSPVLGRLNKLLDTDSRISGHAGVAGRARRSSRSKQSFGLLRHTGLRGRIWLLY